MKKSFSLLSPLKKILDSLANSYGIYTESKRPIL